MFGISDVEILCRSADLTSHPFLSIFFSILKCHQDGGVDYIGMQFLHYVINKLRHLSQ
jgi:hypothetical protein